MFQILTTVCESHKLALAQTWVPCKHSRVVADGGGDADTWGFGNALVEHHLQKGQGVGGRAFSSKSSCFSSDMTQLSKSEVVPATRHDGLKQTSDISGLRLGDNEGEQHYRKNLHCYPFK
ncbi:hypothetical protein IFM89_018797 [Coptis chinensis]|uniref:NLP1-9 GAF domain-containing protein n=1 Tax=Coptis chinensis TaxID=261450 RepID=A0A835ID34_9MAGN|nr:hypothetical protein IFM89_018797 [Coptis chinensis]